jgi:hypothetical protein
MLSQGNMSIGGVLQAIKWQTPRFLAGPPKTNFEGGESLMNASLGNDDGLFQAGSCAGFVPHHTQTG